MPLNQQKIMKIIVNELESVEERCDGYKEELTEVLSDILLYERAHRVSRIEIQKKIDDKLNSFAKLLANERAYIMETED